MHLQETGLPIKLRPALATDKPFIKHSWMGSFMVSPFAGSMKKSVYKQFQRSLIEDLLSVSNTMVLCHEDLEDEIFTYCTYRKIGEATVIDYIYTKEAYRKMGLAKILLKRIIEGSEKQTVFFTHTRWPGKKTPSFIVEMNMIYNPYLLMSVK